MRGVVFAGSALLLVFDAANMLVPVAIGWIVAEVVAPAAAGEPFGTLLVPGLSSFGVLLALFLLMNLGNRFGSRLGWLGVQRATYGLSQAVLSRIVDERGLAGPPRPPGSLLALATGDVHRACLVLYLAVYPPAQLLGLGIAGGVLFGIHPGLGFGVLLSLLLGLLLSVLIARPLQHRSAREQSGLADAAASAADLVSGFRVIRGLHAQDSAADRYRRHSRRALHSTLIARGSRAVLEGSNAAIAQLSAAAIALAATALALGGAIRLSDLVTVAGISLALLGPLEALTSSVGSFWAVSQASAGRLLALLDSEASPATAGCRVPGKHGEGLSFDDLCLSEGVRLSARIGPAELVVAELGQIAAAELGSVLALDRIPASGTARYGRYPVADYQPTQFRNRVLVAPRHPALFPGTVLDNVLRAAGPAAEVCARAALRAAGLLPDELPDGYGTVVLDEGSDLSGGQRQRIALARALAAEPDVLVLNDPTSSVDTVTEQRIARGVREFRSGRSTIVLTRSTAFAHIADRVLPEPTAEVVRASATV